ncbi:spermatogonial stem-cell renewal factor [Penaeus vannamei]|uniref:Spermatogonial stem-cell renewal factor n=1 Tax=Penaeus vannamei TaxID=6689 RepID=A0A423SEZ1_PENVA|nr:spermatogonial stem-cell renewal factor [Penaeus vannamei]
MYAARDVTSTVKSVPLIVSSIVSKKAAETVSGLVLDVKFGGGAFMKTQEEAGALAKKMVDVANGVGMATTALLTTMDVPLGRAIGNALEVREAIECLRGNGPRTSRSSSLTWVESYCWVRKRPLRLRKLARSWPRP